MWLDLHENPDYILGQVFTFRLSWANRRVFYSFPFSSYLRLLWLC